MPPRPAPHFSIESLLAKKKNVYLNNNANEAYFDIFFSHNSNMNFELESKIVIVIVIDVSIKIKRGAKRIKYLNRIN